MHFRPLHCASRRVLPAVGFLTAVQMAAGPALAQETPGPGMSRIVGATVCDALGERLGEVKDIVLDGHGALAYAVVAARGTADTGDRWHAVPWRAMRAQLTQGEQVWVLGAGKAALERDAGFGPQQWPDFADATWQAGNLRHYGLRQDNT